MKSQIESTEHLLTCLGLAIDEAKLARGLIKSQDLARKLKAEHPFSERLKYLIKIRSKANRGNLRGVQSQNPYGGTDFTN